jgi:hypothetical protein
MNPAMIGELLLPLAAALVLLTSIKLATRKPAIAKMKRPQAQTTARPAMRAFAKKGASVATISQSTRTPHDVVSLALYVEQRRLSGHRAAIRS